MSASALHVRPWARTPSPGPQPERRLLPPLDPGSDRQTDLRPMALFMDRSRALTEESPQSPGDLGEPAATTPDASALTARRRTPTPLPLQTRMPLPSPPSGKGKSMGTGDLTRAEKEAGEAVTRERLPSLPQTGARLKDSERGVVISSRAECLSYRAHLPAATEHPPKGDKGPRLAPCPFVSCRHHLYLDVNPESGAIKINFPGLERMELAETWPRPVRRVRIDGKEERLVIAGPPQQHAVLDLGQMEDTCSLDVGDRGERRDPRRRKLDLKVVGRKVNLTLEWTRRLIEHAQGEMEAKVTDGQVIRPMEGEDPNDGAEDAEGEE